MEDSANGPSDTFTVGMFLRFNFEKDEFSIATFNDYGFDYYEQSISDNTDYFYRNYFILTIKSIQIYKVMNGEYSDA